MEYTPPKPGDGFADQASEPGVLKRGVDSAGSALHNTIDMVVDPARSTVDRVSSAAHNTVEKLADQAASVADRFSDQAQWASDAPERAMESSREWIRDKPLEAVGIALAVGYLWGRWSSH